jgi:TM2 domain-containing membrane protein YozV
MKSKKTAVILALTLGMFGAHRFYLGQKGKGLFCLIPLVGWLFSLTFALYWILGSKESFDKKYNSQAIQKEILETLKNK